MKTIPVLKLTDDAKIKAILVASERATCLEPRPGVPTPVRYHLTWFDETAYYCVCRYYGYPDPADNGYAAWIIPHEACTGKEALEYFQKEVVPNGQTGPEYLNLIEELKPQNS